MNIRIFHICIYILSALTVFADDSVSRWQIDVNGAVRWTVNDRIPHYDHVEMSGERVSAVLRYGVNSDGSFSYERSIVWPMLRTIPNDTHGSLKRRLSHDFLAPVMVNRLTLNNERVKNIKLDGKMMVTSEFTVGHTRATKDKARLEPSIEVTRTVSPSPLLPMLCEKYSIKNIGDGDIEVCIPAQRIGYSTPEEQGVNGIYKIVAKTEHDKDTIVVIRQGDSVDFGASVQAYKASASELSANVSDEIAARDAFVDYIRRSLVFDCPDSVLNTHFAFAKVRASESIFRTKSGLLQSPGGETYYAAIWANDQAEYLNPFLPFLGYDKGNESAMNSFRQFARFMNEEYNPIPSSIIAEGDDIWKGAGDRGDAAMIAYGAARFALANGDMEDAQELFPLIEWCLEYCHRKINTHGVVTSDTDELEGRFPSGDANLCTSTLYYDALISGSCLAAGLGKNKLAAEFRTEAAQLRKSIENYFGATVEGFDTYQYYAGNELLRSWICMPLVTGILDRKDGTVAALLSPGLMTSEGLLTQSGTETYWDRSTLYAMRGIFAAGESDKALDFLSHYSSVRLLGEHVPYPIEAWPEGNQRHLSTESALYCRIITEGLFGIRPAGFSQFELTPHMPDSWNRMALRNVAGFGSKSFDIEISRSSNGLDVIISRDDKVILNRRIRKGQTISVRI